MSAPPSRPLVFKSSPATCWSFCQALGWAGQTPTSRKGTAPCQGLVLAVKAGSHKSGKASLRQRNRGCERQAWEAAGGTAGRRGRAALSVGAWASPARVSSPRQRLGPSVLASLHLQLLTLSVLFSLVLNTYGPSAVLKDTT